MKPLLPAFTEVLSILQIQKEKGTVLTPDPPRCVTVRTLPDMALACPSYCSPRRCLGIHQSPRIVPCRPSGWGHLLGMQEWGERVESCGCESWYTTLCLGYFLAIARETREWMVTLPEALSYSSWKSCSLKKALWWECKEKAPGFGRGLSLAVAELGTAVSRAAIQLDSAPTHSLQKAEKETGKNDMRFPWLLDCLLSSNCYHKFCRPNKQQMSEIMFGFGERSFRIHHRDRYWPGAQGSGTSSSVGKTWSTDIHTSKHWAWSPSSVMFPNCIEFLDFMFFCDGCWN